MSIFDQFADLPEDPELAFVELETKYREDMLTRIEQSDGYSIVDIKMAYVNRILGAQEALEINFLPDPRLVRVSEEFHNEFDEFFGQVDRSVTRIALSHFRRHQSIRVVVELSSDMKGTIQEYISKIRGMIRAVDLSPPKREAILRRLDALSFEIESDRTKVEAFTATSLEIASASGAVARELKPVKDTLESIEKILGKAKRIGEQLRIGFSGEPKLIEPPKDLKSEEDSDSQSDSLDDDIPF